jgi:hypothetical protein
MSSPEAPFVHALWITALGCVALAVMLSLLPRLGMAGWKLSEAVCRAPLLDLVVASFTWIPWVLAVVLGGWPALIGAVMGQFAALAVWIAGHELAYRKETEGPRIVKFHSRIVGNWQNQVVLYATLVALPVFWWLRIMQITMAWIPARLLGFPRYKQSEWVQVSRHKFEGLVGHDLIWCLYCDWMTGVYSLGAEILRNVESFWCPIRFYDGKKCANCAVDFPDVNNGWVPHDANMTDVLAKMEEMYGDGQRGWFGHPARVDLTVRGKPL